MTNIVPFDTLELARALREEAGFDQRQAEGTAKVLARVLVADLATKSDVETLRNGFTGELTQVKSELTHEIGQVRTELTQAKSELTHEIGQVRTELKQEIGRVETELKRDITRVESSVEIAKRDLTIRLGGMIVVAVGLLAALMTFLSRLPAPLPHP